MCVLCVVVFVWSLPLFLSLYVYISIHIYIYIYIYINISCIYIYIYDYIWVHIHGCIHIYIYIYIYVCIAVSCKFKCATLGLCGFWWVLIDVGYACMYVCVVCVVLCCMYVWFLCLMHIVFGGYNTHVCVYIYIYIYIHVLLCLVEWVCLLYDLSVSIVDLYLCWLVCVLHDCIVLFEGSLPMSGYSDGVHICGPSCRFSPGYSHH